MQVKRVTAFPALFECITGKELLDGEIGCQADQVGKGQQRDTVARVQPHGAQELCQPVRRVVELPVRHDLAAAGQIQVKVNGVDVFHPNTGEIRSDGAEGIACWFIDTDYNEESFFVRHAYFLGANDPYSALKTTLKAEIDPDAWATLNSDTSRAFPKPKNGRIAVKVINHLGDEVMKVFRVE